jgi:hypothetical protein
MSEIKIDMNNPEFQRDFFELEKTEQAALIRALKKIRQLRWSEDKALNWEAILSKKTKAGERIYSFRFSRKYRTTALRQGDFLRLLTLHADHDSAY